MSAHGETIRQMAEEAGIDFRQWNANQVPPTTSSSFKPKLSKSTDQTRRMFTREKELKIAIADRADTCVLITTDSDEAERLRSLQFESVTGYMAVTPLDKYNGLTTDHVERLAELGVTEVLRVGESHQIEKMVLSLGGFTRCGYVEDLTVPNPKTVAGSHEYLSSLFADSLDRGIPSEIFEANQFEDPFMTAREMFLKDPTPVNWIVSGLVAEGAITLVSGKVKSGKTTLNSSMARAVTGGETFLENPTVRGDVVYVSEESESTLRAHFRRHNLVDNVSFYILSANDEWAFQRSFEEMVEVAIWKVKQVGAKLLFFDTLSSLSRVDDENDAAKANLVVRMLRHPDLTNCGVVIVSHDRKSGGGLGDSSRGSSAYAGAADILIQLLNDPTPGHSNRRVIKGVGRPDGVISELVVEYTNGAYTPLGAPGAIDLEQAQSTVLDQLPKQTDSNWMTERELLDVVGGDFSRSTVKRALDELTETKQVVRKKGFGAKKPAYGYALNEGDEHDE